MGDTRPCSYADNVERDVPERRANSALEIPTRFRAAVSRLADIDAAYQIRYGLSEDRLTGPRCGGRPLTSPRGDSR